MLEIHETIEGHSRIDFDKAKVRRALRSLGRDVQKTARRLVARRAISQAGDYPGRQSGELWRGIKYRVSRSGFLVKIMPEKTPTMDAYYPAFLHYGVAKRNLAPRRNYMTDALASRRSAVRASLRDALADSLVPRA